MGQVPPRLARSDAASRKRRPNQRGKVIVFFFSFPSTVIRDVFPFCELLVNSQAPDCRMPY